MEHRRRNILYTVIILTNYIYLNEGCEIQNVNNWLVPVSTSVYDNYTGIILARDISNIEGINSITYGEGTNSGPYLDVSLTNSQFVIATSDDFVNYEEYETSRFISVTVNFRCSGTPPTRSLVVSIEVIDTNNNAPQFRPTNEFVFTVAPPLPPGYLITGCLNDIIVRDIDLTTYRIDFGIEDNHYFEIDYDAEAITENKEFKAILKTATFIRSIPEPLTFRITATDVDETGDPPITTSATVTIIGDSEFEFPEEPVFTQAFYLASYSDYDEVVLYQPISLQSGYHEDVIFNLDGENSNNFELVQNDNQITLNVVIPLSMDALMENQIFLVVRADREYASGGSATIILQLPEDVPIEFDRAHYNGTIENNILQVPQLLLTQGYQNRSVSAVVVGDYSSYFNANFQGNAIDLTMTALNENIIDQNSFIYLQVDAITDRSIATTVVTLEIIKDDNVTPIFDKPIYTGTYETNVGLTLEQILLVQGYDEAVIVSLNGDHASYFQLVQNGSVVTLSASTIPSEIYIEQRILLSVEAIKPRTVGATAAIVITLPADTHAGSDVSFEKVLYDGNIQGDTVQHESITISGFIGTTVDLDGEYSSLFVANVTNGLVTVQASGPLTLPTHVTTVPLVIDASEDKAVLLLTVLESDAPAVPTVTFGSPFYTISVEIVQTGWVGRVQATADNGEAIVYSLLVENEHLQSRIAINNEGELHLSAPANSGVYSFEVVATTAITQASATATVYLSVEAITVCGENDIVVPPLIILDRDEEEPHRHLVLLNNTQYPGCQFTLTNRWPAEQSWLYVDENGLHTTAIDREDPSIAFMALSQVKVELILHCDEDNPIRTKRSERTEWLDPYDYGTYNWVLADSISYNSRRTVVNLIVNDINDNEPIFVGKEDEPIVVGYPNAELEESILPRSLAELQATDADIGENAQLLYWSSENHLAVAPMTGFIHLQSGAELQDDQVFVVHATDRNGEGLTGSIQLLVRLLDINNIAIVTIQDAFLDDEQTILTKLNEAVGYEVKTLKSIVISDNAGDENSRKKREANTAGALLQLYVYGLIEREPVAVDRLSDDINNNAAAVVNVISTLSLEDHLESIVIPGRDTGLLVSTIVLSVLLFILIILIGLWYFLRWRKNRNYDEFSDENSLASRNNTMDSLPKQEVLLKPRLNIEELKKSERRLQKMLNAPMEDIILEPEEPSTSKAEKSIEAVLDLSLLEPQRPIVIQSIDKLKDAEDDTDDDEFGEKSGARRKSVVTFNENVEKIIHVEDNPDEADDSEDLEYEIYKF